MKTIARSGNSAKLPGMSTSHSALALSRRTESRGGRGPESDRGSVLILALVYIVAISLIVGALATWALNDLNNTTHFDNASASDYAISGATEVAIQSIRYTPIVPQTAFPWTGTGTPPDVGYCWQPASPGNAYVSQVTIDSDQVAVWCSTVQNLASSSTRVVTLYACASSLTSSSSETAVLLAGNACQQNPALTATVAFNDYPAGDSNPLTQTCGPGDCGYGAITEEWNWA
jgi:hypothetical protein